MASSNISNKVSLETIWNKGGRNDLQTHQSKYAVWQILLITIAVIAIFVVVQNVSYQPIMNVAGITGFSFFTGISALTVWGGGLIVFGILTKKLSLEEIKAKPIQFGGWKWVLGTVGIAILSYIAVFIINFLMLSFLPLQPSEIRGDLIMGGGVLWVGILTGSFLAPVAEELFFRGFLFTSLRKCFGFWSSSLLSSLFFGLIHGDPIAIVYAFVLGIIFAAVYERSKSIYISILLHMLINFISTMISFLVLTYLL